MNKTAGKYDHIIKTKMTNESFNILFDIMLKKYGGIQEQAYEACEHEHMVKCGSRRYNSFESFRSARSRSINAKKSRS